MKLKLNHAKTLGALLIIAASGAGCGLTTSYIEITYAPPPGAEMFPGAKDVKVKVDVSDQRAIKDRVGRKGNEYSFLGPIISKNDVAKAIAGAIETELVNRGFRLGDGSVDVAVELSKFYADYRMKSLSEEIVGEIVMQVQVRNRQGNILFAKLINSYGTEGGDFVRSGNDTKLALEKALADAISKLVNDPAFTDTLLKHM